MRLSSLVIGLACLAFVCGQPNAVQSFEDAAPACASRATKVEEHAVTWHQARSTDAERLNRWCEAVGPPILVPAPAAAGQPPTLDELVVVTWNAHLAAGRVAELVQALRGGRFTAGRPVTHFVLLLQEAFRRGADVPAFTRGARTAFAIIARDAKGPDIKGVAATLGLSLWYVPSMRNGAGVREDRGNAILSTESLTGLRALELPLERQRRVAIGATVSIQTNRGLEPLALFNVHLEPVSAPRSLWFFRNPRRAQIASALALLADASNVALGGDFNTIQRSDQEPAYALARKWSTGFSTEDRRKTHLMGRLDYLFFRSAGNWTLASRRLDERFGSDHNPVLGRFSPSSLTKIDP